jgi:hypothetical protein
MDLVLKIIDFFSNNQAGQQKNVEYPARNKELRSDIEKNQAEIYYTSAFHVHLFMILRKRNYEVILRRIKLKSTILQHSLFLVHLFDIYANGIFTTFACSNLSLTLIKTWVAGMANADLTYPIPIALLSVGD